MLIACGVLLCLFCLGFLVLLSWELVSDHSYQHRGIRYGTPPNIPQAAVYPLGVNASLEHYEGEDLDRALTMMEAGGFRWVRQRFPWAEIEPEEGEFDWEKWDAIVAAALEHDLAVIAVLETSPSWARAPIDGHTPQAPPRDFGDFAQFAGAFAAHFREEIDYYEIWDQPNLYPHWGERYIDPTAYTHLLQEAYGAVKEGDPEALILTAGLSPNVEEGGRYMSDILFLRKMYEAGAKGYFDILAVKPYGMWYEPTDRRLSPLQTNFSRSLLLRDVMLSHGDGDKALWAVEFGWCALPLDWTGRPAPWGSDREDIQARRTVEAIERARNEWPWMGVMALQHFHPVAEPDDPIQGFALVTDDFTSRLTYEQVQALAQRGPTAYVGWYPSDAWAARYQGSWLHDGVYMTGALAGDEVVLPFKGTRLDVVIQPPFHLSEVTADGELATALTGGSLRLDGSRERTVTLAHGLPDEEHVVRFVVGSETPLNAGIRGFVVIRETSFVPYYLSLLLLAGAAVIVVWRLSRLLVLPRSLEWWAGLGGWYLRREEWQQILILALVLCAYHFSPWTVVSLAALVVLASLVYLRLDLALALTVFSIPFFLRPKIIAGQSISAVEMLTIICFATWLLREAIERGVRRAEEGGNPLALFPRHPFLAVRLLALGLWDLLVHLARSASSLDFAVLFFLALSIFSLTVSENFGVSFYELRTVIVVPIIFYLLVREAPLGEDGLLRLVDAVVLSALALSVYGLYQYFFTGDIITAEGVRRIRSVYGSPNNLGLFLGRVVPLSLAFIFFGAVRWRRWLYLSISVPVILCLYLTHSRGAWLLGLPAALLFLGIMKGRRALAAAVGAVAVAILALLPVAKMERITSLFDFGGGTTFQRLKLWEGSLKMIRDHPLFGVGLDNFLYQYPRYMLPEAWQEPDLSHPHNIVLDWWTRLGVLGVGTLIWLEMAFFRTGLRLYRSLRAAEVQALILGLMASMVGFLAHGLIDNSYFLVDLGFFFFLTLGIVRRLSLAH